MPLVIRKKGEAKKKKLPKAPPSRPRHANPKHPMNAERTGPLRKKGGGKLKMVEKDGKKVPFFAADGIGKMNKGGPVKVRKGMTLSQIAKDKGVTLKSILAANPSIKNANQIRVGQSIKIPGVAAGKGAKSSNPYKGMSKTQMNMLNVKNKDRGKQRAVTQAMRTQVKSGGAPTAPTPKKAAAAKDSRSAIPKAKKEKLIAKMKADKANKPKKKSLLSRLFGKKAGGSMKKVPEYKSGGIVRGAGAATKGKRFGRAG